MYVQFHKIQQILKFLTIDVGPKVPNYLKTILFNKRKIKN